MRAAIWTWRGGSVSVYLPYDGKGFDGYEPDPKTTNEDWLVSSAKFARFIRLKTSSIASTVARPRTGNFRLTRRSTLYCAAVVALFWALPFPGSTLLGLVTFAVLVRLDDVHKLPAWLRAGIEPVARHANEPGARTTVTTTQFVAA